MTEALFETVAEPTPRITEAEILRRLRLRYTTRNGNGPRWAVIQHVRDRAGFDATRTLDAVVMDTWKSSGLALHGFEIKTSRGDWRRELAQPEKSAAFTRWLDYFWIVAPKEAVRADELPDGFGLLVIHGAGLRVSVQATRRVPEQIDRSFVACLLRAACHREPQPD